jgi:hypothetical protein
MADKTRDTAASACGITGFRGTFPGILPLVSSSSSRLLLEAFSLVQSKLKLGESPNEASQWYPPPHPDVELEAFKRVSTII